MEQKKKQIEGRVSIYLASVSLFFFFFSFLSEVLSEVKDDESLLLRNEIVSFRGKNS